MKPLTERQLRRREDILSAARQLIAERGFDGVTMRDLSAASSVALKTLYHQFENKEKLLATAVEEQYRHVYQVIDDTKLDKGLDKLLFIIDSVADMTMKNEAYARALLPLWRARSTVTSFGGMRLNIYRKAIEQIASEGELEDWIGVSTITAMIYRHASPVYLAWMHGEVAGSQIAGLIKLDACLTLSSVTSGETHQRANETAKILRKALKRKAD